MPTSFSAHHTPHDDDQRGQLATADFADHLDREGRISAPVIAAAVEYAAAALDVAPSRIVDLGAGTGTGSLALARRFPTAQVERLDVSADLLGRLGSAAAAAGFAEQIRTVRVDLDADWRASVAESSDLIWAALSLHHVNDAAKVLERAYAALRPGGVLVLTEMTGYMKCEPGDLGSGVEGLADRVVNALADIGYPASADWTEELTTAGFAPVTRHEHTVIAHTGTVDGARYVTPQLESWRARLAPALAAEDVAGLGQAVRALTDGHAHVTLTSERAIWVAQRPVGEQRPEMDPADERHTSAAEQADAASSGTEITADVVVVGGGAAGLAASIALARSRRDVVVIDAGQPRNAPSHGAHNVLGNEGVEPRELLRRGRAEAESYGVRVVDGFATDAHGSLDDFTIDVDGGRARVRARRTILASGLVDDLPDVPGVREAWGESVLHCPFCHGWEIRDKRIGILTRGEVAVHHAMLFRELSDDVTMFLNDAAELTEDQWDQLAVLNVRVVRGRVDRLLVEGRQVQAVQIDGGKTFPIDAVIVAPVYNVRTELFEALGGQASTTPFGTQITSDPRGGTDLPGVFTAGNAGEPMAMLVAATASGVTTGTAVHGSLAFADLAAGVAERRAPFSAAAEAANTIRILGDRRHGL